MGRPLEGIPVPALTISRTGKVSAVNPAALRLLRATRKDLVGRPWDELSAVLVSEGQSCSPPLSLEGGTQLVLLSEAPLQQNLQDQIYHLSRLASRLLCGDPDRGVVEFTNGGVVCIARDEERWQLRWAVTPALVQE